MYKQSFNTYNKVYVHLLQVSYLQACNAARPSHSANLVALWLDHQKFSPEEVVFLPVALAKQSREGKPLKELFSSHTIQNSVIVQVLKQYEALTAPLSPRNVTKLFISLRNQLP